MKTATIQLIKSCSEKQPFSLIKLLGKVWIDDLLLYVSRIVGCLIGTVGLVIVLSGQIVEVRREEKIEELIYRRKEDDSLLNEATPDFTKWDRLALSPDHRKMIIRDAIKKRRAKNRPWANTIDSTLNVQKRIKQWN
jgi:hypothetical protein